MHQSLTQITQRAIELRHLLNKADHAYYVLDSPVMEDAVYDNLYRELISIEKIHPQLITKDSPSQRVGGIPEKRFKSAKHKIPLLSLDNAFNIKELKAWYLRIEKILIEEIKSQNSPQFEMVGELKIDGNALALSYSNGILVRGATRGDGSEGEDITVNIRTINSIPLHLQIDDPPKWLEVRGEAFMPNDQFAKINSERILTGENQFANPRNACAGTLRQLNPQIVAARKLDFFAYSIHLSDDYVNKDSDLNRPQKQSEALQWLKQAGFKINPNTELLRNLQEVDLFFYKWGTKRQSLPYATDGVVIKINNFQLQQKTGFTQKAPRWAIALKYAAEEAPSKLKKLTYQVGRTGVITPVAEFEPISLAGTSVSRATLHNANRLASIDLHSGDTIVIRKAGEIIPEVLRVVKELRPSNAERLKLPQLCPECQSKLVRSLEEAATRCINSSCPAILRGTICHWASKGALDIEGLGNKLIEQLVKCGLIKSIASLYELNIDQLADLERMGSKSATKLITAIEKSKDKPWSKQLYGLGINHIGEANATALTEVFPNIETLALAANTNPEDIQLIYGIGNEITQSLKQWFSDPNNNSLINHLKNLGISLSINEREINDGFKEHNQVVQPLQGKIFVLTGSLTSLTRQEAKNLIEKNGGKVTSSVSSKTTFLVAGKNSGSKLNTAQKLKVQIINEQELKNLLSD